MGAPPERALPRFAVKLWVIVGVCGLSRFIGAWMIPSRHGGGPPDLGGAAGAVSAARRSVADPWFGRGVRPTEHDAAPGTHGGSPARCPVQAPDEACSIIS